MPECFCSYWPGFLDGIFASAIFGGLTLLVFLRMVA